MRRPLPRLRRTRVPRHGTECQAVPDLARALAATGAVVLLSDAQHRITWCNEAFTRLSGYTLDEARGAAPGALLRVDEQAEDASADPCADTEVAVRGALHAGKGFRGRLRNRAKSGRIYWLDIDIQPIRDERGRITGHIAVQADVTQQVRTHEHLRKLVNSAMAGIVVQDDEGRIIGCNPEAERLLGVTEADLLGRSAEDPAWKLCTEDGGPLLPDHNPARQARALPPGQAVRGQVIGLPLADGSTRWLSVNCERIEGHDEGSHVVAASFIDITASRLAQGALELANAQLQSLFDLSPFGMSLSDMVDGRFLQCNDAMVRLLGHDHDQLKTLSHRDLIPPDKLAQARANADGLRKHGRFDPHEIDLLHRDGQRVPVLLSGVVAALPDGSRRIWSILQDLTPRKTIETRLRAEAHTDRLTGLPNRALLMERLEQGMARTRADPSQRFALLFLDFDRFKLVNDTLGHAAGDQLLQHVADRLRQSLRTGDVFGSENSENLVARFGGDEFVVLLSEARTAEAAAVVARRLLEVLARPYFVAQREVTSSASIGITLADAHSGDAGNLLRNADMAMYEAKRAGRSTFAFFEPGMLTRVSRAVLIEEALRRAVALDQLSLVYQPIVSLQTGRMTSVEALVRWQHPELGAVPPGEFIPIAEDSGLIVPIGEWVLWQACRQWQAWQREVPHAAPASISVNLSRVQMALGDRLLSLVARVLNEVGMPPNCLQLEVTEREVMRDPLAARKLMDALRATGIKLAMDDFGTGASSLGCLRDYPFDVIKIDKSFIDDMSGPMLAVVHATVAVIENLGMVSVAEGIEQELQVGVLQSLGCRYGQGYFFSRPLPADQLLAALPACRAAA